MIPVFSFIISLMACEGGLLGNDEKAPESCDDTLNLLQIEAYNPNVVRLFFEASDCNGVGLTEKTVNDFIVTEGVDDITVSESSRELLDNFEVYEIRTLLLFDLSGSLQDSGSLPSVQEAAKSFVNDQVWSQPVAIYGFDGRAQIQMLRDFTTDAVSLNETIASLGDFTTQDRSTNLNGAVNEVIDLFESRQAAVGEAKFHGSLVIFTDGKDQSGRVTDDEIETRLSETSHSAYAIGFGPDIDSTQLPDLSPDGSWTAPTNADLFEAFQAVGNALQTQAQSKYALAYCTPKRNGTHTVKIDLAGSSATFEAEFVADGFTGNCDPDNFDGI